MAYRTIVYSENGEVLEPYTGELQQRGIEVVSSLENLFAWLQQNGDYVDYVWAARPDVTLKILESIKQFTKAKLLYDTDGLNYLRERC